jgi:hypothetical protein
VKAVAVAGERRKESRKKLHLPVRVQGRAPDGSSWDEMTSTRDASSSGIAFEARHPLALGQALHLTLPLPKGMRQYDITDPSYNVYALVRDVVPAAPGTSRVGVLFFGKTPPKGWEAGGRFLLPSDPRPSQSRREPPRHPLFLTLKLRRLDESVVGAREEFTTTEDLGRGGARVLTYLPIQKGERVELEEVGGSLRVRAEVRNVFIGPDKMPRLELKFSGAEAQAEVTEALHRAGIFEE